ncbi:tryptophan synthase subunit alpha [Vampirovibrio sp.]|uniref:tryptophan synthase subunit alpha n=1 Tax=Vampirovibrio sp. TaxID=2717857 RepID=UPI003593C177
MSTLKLQNQQRYEKRFAQLKQENRHAMIPFILLGWPNPEVCLSMIDAFIAGGASALELGISFSDPVADGPLIQQAARETMDAGFDVDQAIVLIRKIREKHPETPISLLVYYNLVLARGVEKFCSDIAAAGVDALLIADLPVECIAEIKPAIDACGLQLTSLISTLTDQSRLPSIVEHSGGFLYAVSRLGVTGVEERYDSGLGELLSRVRAYSDLPVCVGFGISQRTHVEAMVKLGADGVIVGSSVMSKIKALAPAYATASIVSYIRDLSAPVV